MTAAIYLIRNHRGQKEWYNIFQVLKGQNYKKKKKKEQNYQSRIQYPEKISFGNEKKINIFSDKGILR